ncbi:hypothetical protein D3C76_1376660 [compost metagenome]
MVVLELLQRLQDIQVQHPVSVKIHQISLGNDRIPGLQIVQLLGQLPDRFKIRGAKGGVHGGFDQRRVGKLGGRFFDGLEHLLHPHLGLRQPLHIHLFYFFLDIPRGHGMGNKADQHGGEHAQHQTV